MPAEEVTPGAQKRGYLCTLDAICVCCAVFCVTWVYMTCVSMFCVSRAEGLAGSSLSPPEDWAGLSLPNASPLPSSWKLVPGQLQFILVTRQRSRAEDHGKYGCYSCLSFLWELIFTCWVEASWTSLGQELAS